MIGLFVSFREVQKFYTVIGAYMFPLLALALIVFNGRTSWVGERFKNRPVTIVALAGVLAFFTGSPSRTLADPDDTRSQIDRRLEPIMTKLSRIPFGRASTRRCRSTKASCTCCSRPSTRSPTSRP